MNRAAPRRRILLDVAVLAGAGALLSVSRPAEVLAAPGPGTKGTGEVSPVEDLMREHGVLRRLLLVYEEGARRLDGGESPPTDALASAAGLMRRFVEDYHEKLEEDFVFPRFEAVNRLRDLVSVLRLQHRAGRRVTDEILHLAGLGRAAGTEDRARLSTHLRAFLRMYRPHAAREDTVLFPALRALVGEESYGELGEAFEDEEHARFGAHGFEDVVAEVARLEQALGIHDLAAFTP